MTNKSSGARDKFLTLINRRIKGIHLHWNNAADNYSNVDEFIIYLNSVLQELRNITFLLQKSGKLYVDFNEWYEEKRNGMKTDVHLKWLHDARTTVVHKEDLEVSSIAQLSLLNWDTFKLKDIVLDPFLGDEEVIEYFLTVILSKFVQKTSDEIKAPLLKIKRVWIDKNYGEVELLELTKYAYDYIIILFEEFFNLIKLEGFQYNIISLETINKKQCKLLDVKNNATIKSYRIKIDINDKTMKQAEKKYGNVKIVDNTGDEIRNLLYTNLGLAKQIILSGEIHKPTFFLLDKNLKPLDMGQGCFEDRTTKYAWIRGLADTIKYNNKITAIVIINEVWLVKKDNWGKHMDNPSMKSSEGEALTIIYFDKEGKDIELILPINRNDGNVSFGKLEEELNSEGGLLNPIAEVWGLIK